MAKLLGHPSFLTHFDAATKMRRNQLLPVPTIHIPKGLPTAEEIHLVEKVQKFMKGNAFKIPLFPEKREHLYQLAVVVERNFGVGTLWGDVMILNNPEASQEERLAAAKRLARWRFSWADKYYLRGRILKDGGARRTLLDLGSAKAKDVNALLIEDLLPNAVFSAAADSETPQYYRVGRNWIKGKDGRKIKVIPDKFSPPLYAEWLLNKALEHCMRLLNPNWKRTGEPVVNFSDLDSPEKANLSKLRPDPEEELSAHELREEIYAVATPGIRRVLDLLIFGYSREEAAKILGLRRSTIDVQLHRLKKKLPHRL